MKGEIIYSKYDRERVTRALDHLLDFRDEFLFATLLKGCRKGYIAGAEYEPKKKVQRKTVVYSVLQIFVTWVIAFLLKMKFFPAGPENAIMDAINIAVVCIFIYVIFLSPRSIHLIKRWHYYPEYERKCKMIWEEREENKYHLMVNPVFFGEALLRAKHRIRTARKKPQMATSMILAEKLYDCACALSVLRQLLAISEEIRSFEERCGAGYTEIEFKEDMRLAYKDPDAVYKIILKGKFPEAEDTVIPVEADEKTKSIAVPYVAGNVIRKRYRKNRRLDLSVLDLSYTEIKRDFGICKREIRDRMKDLGLAEDSAAIQEMDQVRF